MAAEHTQDPFHHVRDATSFEVPQFLGGEWHIPQPFGDSFAITKFMVLEVIAAVIVFLIFRTLAKKAANGEPVRGRFWNFWEAIALYLRDELVRPTIGDDHAHHEADHGAQGAVGHGGHGHGEAKMRHPADQYLPFIWSAFFFILTCNLLGAIPWMGSPTGHLWMTGALALTTLVVVIRTGMTEQGPVGFWKMIPKIEAPFFLLIFLIPLMWVIEFLGMMVKHCVLAIRLFANILAGHTVIAVILAFIAQAGGTSLFYLVAPASVLGQVAVGFLELLVAFLQAYVFVFLATVFIGMARHAH